jgi:chromate transport protein ChrA
MEFFRRVSMFSDRVFEAFGGPPVHFQILHQRFVDGVGGKNKWIDEQTVSGSSSADRAKSYSPISMPTDV